MLLALPATSLTPLVFEANYHFVVLPEVELMRHKDVELDSDFLGTLHLRGTAAKGNY